MAINEKKSLPVVIETSNVPVRCLWLGQVGKYTCLKLHDGLTCAGLDSGLIVRQKRRGGARCHQAAGTPC